MRNFCEDRGNCVNEAPDLRLPDEILSGLQMIGSAYNELAQQLG
jgi:hypothetical protein